MFLEGYVVFLEGYNMFSVDCQEHYNSFTGVFQECCLIILNLMCIDDA